MEKEREDLYNHLDYLLEFAINKKNFPIEEIERIEKILEEDYILNEIFNGIKKTAVNSSLVDFKYDMNKIEEKGFNQLKEKIDSSTNNNINNNNLKDLKIMSNNFLNPILKLAYCFHFLTKKLYNTLIINNLSKVALQNRILDENKMSNLMGGKNSQKK